MEKLTSNQAYEILTENIINEEQDLEKKEHKWINHCLYTGLAAERIAKILNVDSDYAKALGYIHDVGRRISHPNHIIEGYKYIIQKGYPKEAEICLTHSFINNDIDITAGGGPLNHEDYQYIDNFLKTKEITIYDNIIQMCDLFCSENGFTTIENRLLDISLRKGVYPNSLNHVYKTFELKHKLENKMGCDLYSLFPEINQSELKQQEVDYQKLLEISSKPNKQLN